MAEGESPVRLKVASVLGLALILLMVTACGDNIQLQYNPSSSGDEQVRPAQGGSLSATARMGEELFNNNCLRCHGQNATGTNQGPPLVHRLYEPGHHSDASIRSAVLNGVPSHHWSFGDMPPVSGVSKNEVETIICYVREVQRAEGIFEGDAYATMC